MTSLRQKTFYEYLSKLEELDNKNKPDRSYVETALKEFYKYWKQFEKDGVKNSVDTAMRAAESFTGYPQIVHTN